MIRYQNLLFDLDGTLIDTKSGVIGSVKKAFAELSLPLPDDERLATFMGPPLEQCFTEVCGLDPATALRTIGVYRRYYEDGGIYDAQPFDGIPALLTRLKKAGYRLAVATSKNERFAHIVLRHCGIDGFFDSVAGAPDTFDTPWLKKDSVQKAMRDLAGADGTNTVLIGDRMFDAEGAALAGIDSIGVLFGYGTRGELEASGFSAVIPDVKGLEAFFCDGMG